MAETTRIEYEKLLERYEKDTKIRALSLIKELEDRGYKVVYHKFTNFGRIKLHLEIAI